MDTNHDCLDDFLDDIKVLSEMSDADKARYSGQRMRERVI